MRKAKRILWLLSLILTLGNTKPAAAHCDTSPDLSKLITEFEALQTSRLDALLRFGESHNLCFGIEYVDNTLLTELTNLHIQGGTIQQAIKSILGRERLLSVEARNGVIEISQTPSEPHMKNIFDYVIPRFEARRGPVQDMSIGLHMQLVANLNPKITGFAGHYPPGDIKDEVGPFTESNRTIKYLLDEILAQSKGGAWIARVPWRLRGDFTIPQKRRVWTIVEYGVPSTGYAGILGDIAADLESGSDSKHQE